MAVPVALVQHGRATQDADAEIGLPMVALMSNALLFLLIAGMAGSCDARELRRKFFSKDARGILAGVVCQYVILPFFGYLSLGLFPQDSTIAVTLLLVTTSPGGGFSGVWCSLTNADLALSVAMTTASTIACIAALPFNVYLYVKAMYPEMDVEISFEQLALGVVVVVTAVLFGSSMSWFFNNVHFRQGMNTLGSAAGVSLMVIGGASNAVSKDPIWENDIDWFLCVGLPCVLGLGAALAVAWLIGLESPASVAVAIECCYQNTGLALTIALSAVPPSEVGKAAGVPLFYGLIEMALIPVFGISAWKAGWTYADKDLPVWEALLMNFQPEVKPSDDEDDAFLCCGTRSVDGTNRTDASSIAPSESLTYLPLGDSNAAPAPADVLQVKLPETNRRKTPVPFMTRRLGAASEMQAKLAENKFANESFKDGKKQFDAELKDWDAGEEGAALKSDRNPNTVVHEMSALEIACAQDKGKIYQSNARKAHEARRLQKHMVKQLLIKGAPLPYTLIDKNIFSVLQENNFLWFQKDTKMKYQDYVRPRLVVAFADLALSERDRIVEDAFFHEPAKALYSYGCLIEACDIVLKLDRPDKAERAKIHMLKDGLQAKLVHLFAFIDCPLDEDGDGNLDYKSKSHRPLIDHVLCSPNGWLALKQMATADCQHFLGDDELQPFFTRHYHGSLLTQLLVETTGEGQVAFTWRIMVLRWAIFLFWTFVNCFIFAPLIATSGMFFGRTLWIDSRKKRLYAHWHEDRSIRSESGFDYGEKNPDATGPNQPELKFGIQRFLSPACYMLEEPWMTGMLRGVAELGQVLLLGSLRTIPQETLPFWIRLNCVWAIAMLVSEISEVMHLGKIYFKDSLNLAKFIGLILTTFSLSYEVFSDTNKDENQARTMMATGVLLLWLQELRVLYSIPSIGPLVYLVFEMFKDVAKWFVIQLFLVMSFGVAFFTLYGSDGIEECDIALDDSMKWSKNFAELDDSLMTKDQGLITQFFDNMQFDTIARFHDASQGLFYMLPLFGISITGNDKIDCLRKSEHSLMGPVFMIVFLILTMVLLTNMLIAMMNDRFSTEIKAQTRLFCFRNAHRAVMAKYERRWEPPSPFNLAFIFSAVFNSFADALHEKFPDMLAGRKDDKKKEKESNEQLMERLRRTQLKLAKEWYETEKTSELEEQEHAMKQLLDQDAVTAGDIKRMLEKARGQRGKDPYTA